MVTRQKAENMHSHHEGIRGFKKKADAPTMDKIQKPVTVIHVLLKVTTCLYLSPSRKAKSLSTIIAVNVNKDTAHKIKLEKSTAQYA